jgi:uroporphyrinogen-III synthase
MSTPRHILFTRQLAEDLVREASLRGLEITCVSFIETQPVEPSPITPIWYTLAHKPIWAVFTSVHAAEAVFANRFDTTHPLPWRIFALGGETAHALSRFQLAQPLVIADDAAALAKRITQQYIPGSGVPVYFFCGNLRRDTLPEILQQAGIPLQEIIVYETRLTPTKIERPFDGYAFFSPSGVDSFFSLNHLPGHVPCFAIGETTAKALQTYTHHIIISPRPRTRFLLETIYAYFADT